VEKYWDLFLGSFSGYWNYLVSEVLHPSWHNYFYWLLALSLLVWVLEMLFPWRKNQPLLRKGFFLDAFYIAFNFFIFSLIGFSAISNVVSQGFTDLLHLIGMENIVAIQVQAFPFWAKLVIMFVIADFINWNIHRLLHLSPRLWKFHKVHHSVEEMGFAAHMRFHFMESVIYKTLQYIPLAMIGFGLTDFFIVHITALAIGHLNHANIKLSYGPLKYIFNNPAMHIWHHAKEIPGRPTGANYGISLSIWDYIFRTAYLPHDGRDIELGFKNIESYPQDFPKQVVEPFR
jgi:sterol desaturase/sphingolipid hydroxylase (fatty acid hydroxylase superfamily)